ncbi:hypothetical protein QLQ12_32440 [Actinoplanes sp. NEAU-A12]|uniref:Methylmalonyl Co-A mutase-associated GTPase MeaB n=1 Tax=Actinoplanes sandaracinus TaxID=3045177 RepID=A0ABT6WUA2_9ACTN|nr:hypothetical protein [Actinoplanes sandaracinus]MDI6103328.1 hypothetical protein [Actinoplanes sandaracinus]
MTLVESAHPDHRPAARRLVAALQPHAGAARRVGVSGVPGAGKSTLIDALGSDLTAAGHRVAVLAVDPSSARTGGGVLGDRTRMSRLSADPAAFVRPSPTTGTLGGVTRAAREAIVVLEAAGYDVVLVETVGVGQSEIAPAGHRPAPVLTCGAREHSGLDALWKRTVEHGGKPGDGAGAARRSRQQVDWMWALARARIVERFESDPRVRRLTDRLADEVGAGRLTPGPAADEMIGAFLGESF